MKKIRVLHIIKSLGRGGAEMLLPETLKLHNKDDFEFFYIYFLPWKDQMVESIRANGGVVHCLSARNNFLIMLRLFSVIRIARQMDVHLIHAHLPWAGILARLVYKLTNIPVIYTEHNKQERYHFLTRLMNLFTMNWQRCVIAVSEDVGQSIRKHKRNLKASLRIILNGVNIRHFSRDGSAIDAVKNSLKIPPGNFVIGTVAVFRVQKRLDLWIEIAKQILEKRDDIHFVIVGDGPLMSSLKTKVADLHMEDRMHFPGLQTEVRPYFATMDVYMMTSIFEGMPIALLEAMASECAVISTDAGGIREVIRNEVDGLLCPVDEPDRLVSFALHLLDNTDYRKLLSHQARQRVAESFSIDKMVIELEKTYREYAR